jgi:hypothetical protein
MFSNVSEKVTSALNLFTKTKVSDEAQFSKHPLADHLDIDEGAKFQASFTPAMLDSATSSALRISPFMRSRKVLTAKSLGDALRGCDNYAKSKVAFGPMALGCVSLDAIDT